MSELLNNKTVLTVKETARYLGLAESTLAKWRCIGGGPKYLKMGKAVRDRICDLDAYLANHARRHTSEYQL